MKTITLLLVLECHLEWVGKVNECESFWIIWFMAFMANKDCFEYSECSSSQVRIKLKWNY